jgi:uncharacterized membrane protein YtjA (UPF0391 family)
MVIAFLANADGFKGVAGQMKKAIKIFIALLVVFGSIYCFLPTSKELAFIYVVPKIAESSVIQEDVPRLYDMAIEYMKKSISDKCAD